MSEEVSHDDDDMTNVSLYIIPLIDLEVTIVVDPHLASILYSSDEVYNVLGIMYFQCLTYQVHYKLHHCYIE